MKKSTQKISKQKECFQELVEKIYDRKMVDYDVNFQSESGEREIKVCRGTLAKGFTDELSFIALKYRVWIEELFEFTFDPDEKTVVTYDQSNKGDENFDQLNMIANFCKFVGISEFEILDTDNSYNYAYWYTEESPFEVMEHIDEYAPYVKHVVCCNKSNWPEKTEQHQSLKKKPIEVLKYLEHNKSCCKRFGAIIARLLKTGFVPILFDEPIRMANMKSFLSNEEKQAKLAEAADSPKIRAQFEAMKERSKIELLHSLNTGLITGMMPWAVPCTIPEPVLPTNSNQDLIELKDLIMRPAMPQIDIIIVDSKYDKRLEEKTDLEPKELKSGLYDVTRDVLPSIYLMIPSLYYKTKNLYPDIDMNGMIQYKLGRPRIYLKSDRDLDDYALTPSYKLLDLASLSTPTQASEQEQVQKKLISSHEMFDSYRKVCNEHYRGTMRCIERLTELVLSFDLASLIDEVANEELIKSFKQYPQFLPFESDAEDKQQIEEEQPFDASEFSFALLQWIGELGEELERFSRSLCKGYINGTSWEELAKHVKKLKEYVNKEELKQAIDTMDRNIEQLEPENGEPFCGSDDYYDDDLAYERWGDWKTYRLNALEEFRSALESYKEKLCDMMTIDEE